MTTTTPSGVAPFASPDRSGRLRSAAPVVAASAVLLGALVGAAYLAQILLERGLLFMSA